jgi:hypothetical protein
VVILGEMFIVIVPCNVKVHTIRGVKCTLKYLYSVSVESLLASSNVTANFNSDFVPQKTSRQPTGQEQRTLW